MSDLIIGETVYCLAGTSALYDVTRDRARLVRHRDALEPWVREKVAVVTMQVVSVERGEK
jgi:hypothetical protein